MLCHRHAGLPCCPAYLRLSSYGEAQLRWLDRELSEGRHTLVMVRSVAVCQSVQPGDAHRHTAAAVHRHRGAQLARGNPTRLHRPAALLPLPCLPFLPPDAPPAVHSHPERGQHLGALVGPAVGAGEPPQRPPAAHGALPQGVPALSLARPAVAMGGQVAWERSISRRQCKMFASLRLALGAIRSP